MDGILGLTIGFAMLSLYLGIFSIRANREIKKLKKRTRFLHERLEAVEKFNGLSYTHTDIRQIR